ncbi:MAG: hypothetical protein KKE42_10945 [Alphaproteobacteria bacterium]|uniref:hypothetical protein n=1 Tax=Brevundimonas sp. TaxID=1871086 RepID=UPI0017AF6302|nr:hypothetical protein [Brevundimonas sp.]MBU3970623.1 hypothetical protein [Alphaproteobacteria bacterium]MBA3050501.1 hypothetical protein [Brevundimonas sp.]MBU3974300.1 hypothetical protein [Alphaproteobacteria bacterium]MBU4039135.1 hypothetical protein [Alphaproteobacteria bacterium]MBU4135120.1 hypothetical protein [Alphaproteobacteria bacterium]
MTRFEKALDALRSAQRDAEKEATRLEITQPEIAAEARVRADGLADARRIIEGLEGLNATLAALAD